MHLYIWPLFPDLIDFPLSSVNLGISSEIDDWLAMVSTSKIKSIDFYRWAPLFLGTIHILLLIEASVLSFPLSCWINFVFLVNWIISGCRASWLLAFDFDSSSTPFSLHLKYRCCVLSMCMTPRNLTSFFLCLVIYWINLYCKNSGVSFTLHFVGGGRMWTGIGLSGIIIWILWLEYLQLLEVNSGDIFVAQLTDMICLDVKIICWMQY